MTRIMLGWRVLSLGLLLVGCGGAEPAPPSVLLISIDSLRADRLGVYGADRDTSPAIDALAAEGVLFENAVAPSSWTLPSHVSLMTGLSTLGHRVTTPDRRIDPERRLLAEALRDAGYRTGAFVSAPYLHRAYGFDRGFERYENLQGERAAGFPPSVEDHEGSHLDQNAGEVIDRALGWLRELPPGEAPWFAFVHLWDVHYDYLPPAPYDQYFDNGYRGEIDGRGFLQNPRIARDMPAEDLEQLRILYDREVRALDAQVSRLIEAVTKREPAERILVALVSDHGDEFFEHGNKGHTRTLFEESVRVPWILRLPGRASAGRRISTAASLEDVAPTLLALAGAAPLEQATGRDLSPALRGEVLPERPALLNFAPFAALRGESWKLVANRRTGVVRYFDLEADPKEQRPLRAPPEKLLLLKERLEATQAHADALPWQGDGAVRLDDRTRERLRELGYAE